MAMTPSTMIMSLADPAPAFSLPDPAGKRWSLDDFSDARALLLAFICNHCPFVKHIRAELARLAGDYRPRGLAVVAVNSNDVERYPDDSPEKMAAEARDAGYTFPYLFDEDQSVAKAYGAACTPDFFLFDERRLLRYRGQLDDSRPPAASGGQVIPVTGRDLRDAIDAVLAGRPVSPEQRPSIGCNIKWKPGNEPEYFTNPPR